MWSWIKKKARQIWRGVKAVVRIIVRVVITFINAFTYGLYDLLLGFIAWPPKRLRMHVFILWDEQPGGGDPLPPIEQVAQEAVDRTKKLYKDKFNVDVRPYSKTFIEKLNGPVPDSVLDFECGLGQEFGEAGEFFAQHLAGWNGIPIALTFPITVFVIRSFKGQDLGCSMYVLGDYVVITRQGLMENVTLAHETGHTCGLWHSGTSNNLMFRSSPAGENVKWFQKNILRSSRNVQYW
jgi:hypothetical protein